VQHSLNSYILKNKKTIRKFYYWITLKKIEFLDTRIKIRNLRKLFLLHFTGVIRTFIGNKKTLLKN